MSKKTTDAVMQKNEFDQLMRTFTNWGAIDPFSDLDMGHIKLLLDSGFNDMSEKEQKEACEKMLLQQQEDYLAEIEQHAQAGEWDKVCSIIRLRPFIMELAFDLYYDRLPDNMKYEFVTDLYTHHGDHCPNIRKALTEVRKYGSPELPDWMKDRDVITIYRGGSSKRPITDGISWSTSKDVAEFFANRRAVRHGIKCHVYEAKIRPTDIIAYTNDREEEEVMQYRSVFDVREVPFEPGRVTTL